MAEVWAGREELVRELAHILVRIGALRFGAFTLTSGKMSSYYIDLRIVPSFPDVFERVCSMYEEMARRDVGTDSFDRIASVPVAGIPFATCLSIKLRKPLVIVRKEAKTHGRGKRIEGIIKPGDRVLLVDDLITTGRSLRSTAKALRGEGGVVEDALVLIDRQEGGRGALASDGIKLHSLAEITEVAKVLYEEALIGEEEYKAILRQVGAES